MINNPKFIMDAVSSEVEPRESVLHDSVEKIKWYPVMKFGPYGSVLGIHEDGRWVIATKDGLHVLSQPGSFWKLVILLEQPLNEVQREMVGFFNSFNTNVDINNLFPFVEIVRAGLDFGTKHWAEMAFQWYDELPAEKKKELEDSLVGIENAKWASQQLHHKARKELKKLECT